MPDDCSLDIFETPYITWHASSLHFNSVPDPFSLLVPLNAEKTITFDQISKPYKMKYRDLIKLVLCISLHPLWLPN
jgi:hypothetical protein